MSDSHLTYSGVSRIVSKSSWQLPSIVADDGAARVAVAEYIERMLGKIDPCFLLSDAECGRLVTDKRASEVPFTQCGRAWETPLILR